MRALTQSEVEFLIDSMKNAVEVMDEAWEYTTTLADAADGLREALEILGVKHDEENED